METLHHPKLGKIRGKIVDDVRSFLGLPYASLKHRFAEPQLVLQYAGHEHDATKPGPIAANIPNACEREHDLIQCSLPSSKFDFAELDCLNLSVHTPAATCNGLPVVVFIHGGGFATGSHAWPQYDLARIVRQSVKDNQPIIGIGINYRLGLSGFLYSENLRRAGIKPNRGLMDQQAALSWINRNIHNFGGDSRRITLLGESAGAVSIFHHLSSVEPLFGQVIAMSGTPLLMKALPPPAYEHMYKIVLEALDIKSQNPHEELEALLQVTSDDILNKVPPTAVLLPVEDAGTINLQLGSSNLEKSVTELPGLVWCRRIMTGDCQLDSSVSMAMLQSEANLVDRFRLAVSDAVQHDDRLTQLVLDTYDVKPISVLEEVSRSVLRFISDIGFYVPTISIADSWPADRAFVYHFNERNPWAGPFKGFATHILDVAFLLQNYSELLSEEQRTSSEDMARHVITFVNGKNPFPPFKGKQNGGAHVYGPCGQAGFIVFGSAEAVGRNSRIWKLGNQVGLDRLLEAFQNILKG